MVKKNNLTSQKKFLNKNVNLSSNYKGKNFNPNYKGKNYNPNYNKNNFSLKQGFSNTHINPNPNYKGKNFNPNYRGKFSNQNSNFKDFSVRPDKQYLSVKKNVYWDINLKSNWNEKRSRVPNFTYNENNSYISEKKLSNLINKVNVKNILIDYSPKNIKKKKTVNLTLEQNSSEFSKLNYYVYKNLVSKKFDRFLYKCAGLSKFVRIKKRNIITSLFQFSSYLKKSN